MINFDQRAWLQLKRTCIRPYFSDFLKDGRKGRNFLRVENFYVYGTIHYKIDIYENPLYIIYNLYNNYYTV